ncbi:hypothetical protein CAP31_13345 [Sulfuriferula sp. AH1]|uniref:tetratricopeptide repeat protein n=1 Tax=Sulfuriferula sp. AH1 TaxID=1985873 RepID=UPI000B3B6C2F|nr:tetratricopeptide repeat protein [Sulfuriferula sp. AH1]ARU32578.1 hypothetical protein CAP31_13345 [Sulfuriferula sp. AH1]
MNLLCADNQPRQSASSSRRGGFAALIVLAGGLFGQADAAPQLPAANAALFEQAPSAPGKPLIVSVAASSQAAAATTGLRWGQGVLQKDRRGAAASKTSHPAPPPKHAAGSAVSLTSMLDKAWHAYQAGEYSLAHEYYEQVLGGDDNVDVQLGLAVIALRQNQSEQARQHFQRALMLDPRNVTALAGLAASGDELHVADTEAQIRQLLEQQPSAALQFSLGNLYAGQRRWREAEAAYFESYQANTRNADYAYNLAVSLDYLRLYPVALNYYLKARELASGGGGHGDELRLNNRIRQLQDAVSQSR